MLTRTVFAIGLTAVATVGAAEPASVYTSWSDWGFRPVERQDEKSGDNCRYYADLSDPMHGPWITNPTATGMTITWITRAACGAAVDLREKGEKEFRRQWIATQGAIDYLKKIHTIYLTGLKPGTAYEYRLVTTMAVPDYYSHEPWADPNVYTFRTVDPKAALCTAFFTSDVHGSPRLTLGPMLARGHGDAAQLVFFLGDNVDDGLYNDAEYWMTFCFLDECSYRFAKERPLVAIRGNHDCWGREACRWSEFLPRPDDKAYFTVRQGPVLFLLVDCFEEYRGGTTAAKQYAAAYQQEMADWLKAQKSTADWKDATYRVVLCHYGVVTDFSVVWPRKVFGEILHDTSPVGRVHLFMCGHEHRHRRKDPGAVGFENLRLDGCPVKPQPPKIDKKTKKPVPQKVYTNDYPFVELELDTSDAVTLEATKEKLSIRAWDWRMPGKDVKCYDAIDIAPDGKVATPTL